MNRNYIPAGDETTFPQYMTVSNGLSFLRRNHQSDNPLLQIEMFDPHGPFSFTKGLSTMRVPAPSRRLVDEYETMLFDLQNDPGQTKPIRDEKVEAEKIERLKAALQRSDAPKEVYERYGIALYPGEYAFPWDLITTAIFLAIIPIFTLL